MKAFSFDEKTAREVIGDAEARRIEERARKDADAGSYAAPKITVSTYWDGVVNEMRSVIYDLQHSLRLARNKRKASN